MCACRARSVALSRAATTSAEASCERRSVASATALIQLGPQQHRADADPDHRREEENPSTPSDTHRILRGRRDRLVVADVIRQRRRAALRRMISRVRPPTTMSPPAANSTGTASKSKTRSRRGVRRGRGGGRRRVRRRARVHWPAGTTSGTVTSGFTWITAVIAPRVHAKLPTGLDPLPVDQLAAGPSAAGRTGPRHRARERVVGVERTQRDRRGVAAAAHDQHCVVTRRQVVRIGHHDREVDDRPIVDALAATRWPSSDGVECSDRRIRRRRRRGRFGATWSSAPRRQPSERRR